jgi:hypothetical protein
MCSKKQEISEKKVNAVDSRLLPASAGSVLGI